MNLVEKTIEQGQKLEELEARIKDIESNKDDSGKLSQVESQFKEEEKKNNEKIEALTKKVSKLEATVGNQKKIIAKLMKSQKKQEE